MELRHLRYYIAVAEELHFVRAAERLHMEQSPLSRAIKDLEHELGVRLLDRTTRNTRMTWAGQVFLDEARRVLAAVEQAKAAARAAANGYHGHLRIALAECIAQPRFAALLARCREEEPDIEVRIFEMPLAQQVKGLRGDLLDAGFAFACEVPEGLVAEAVWSDPLAVVLPVRHQLASCKRVEMAEALQHPFVMCHPEAGSGCHEQIGAFFKALNAQPEVADYATTPGVMLTMVGAGYGIGFVIASHASVMHRPDVVVRPLVGSPLTITTYLIRPQIEPSVELANFIERAKSVPLVELGKMPGSS